MSTALHSGPGDGVSFERELLYKVLFDLQADVNDLKRMLTELMQRRASCRADQRPGGVVAGFRPQYRFSGLYGERGGGR